MGLINARIAGAEGASNVNTMTGYHDQTENVLCMHSAPFHRTIIAIRRVIVAGRRRGDCSLLLRDSVTTSTADPDLHHAFPTVERHSGLMNFDNLSRESINPLKPGNVTHKYFARIKYHLRRGQKAGKTQHSGRLGPGVLEV